MTFNDHLQMHCCIFYCIQKYIFELFAIQISAIRPKIFCKDAALQGNYWSSTFSEGLEAEKLLWLNWQIADVVLWLLSIRIAAASSDTVFGIKTKEKVVRWGVIHIRVWRHRIGHGLANGQAKETCPRIRHSDRMSIGQLCVWKWLVIASGDQGLIE